MKIKLILVITVLSIFILESCYNLKEIQNKVSGNYQVIVLNETGNLKQGSNTYYLEFRNKSDNNFIDIKYVSVSAVMQMSGIPMPAETTIKQTDTPGRYELNTNFSMSGTWSLMVTYGKGDMVQFFITVL